jgi:uroporphyrinogen decarboxylase
MRQAGRYMPEYRAIRARYGFLDMVKTPEIAAEITLQPIKALPVDAAIIYSDILPPLEGMGLNLTYEQGEGPVIHNPILSLADVAALRTSDPRETMHFSLDAIRLVQRDLAGRIPLIGFSGAPFTLASYAIEGAGSREYRRTKLLMYQEPATWQALMNKLSILVSDYLIAQAEAGVNALQIFDSWAGALAPNDYREYVLPAVQAAIQRTRSATNGQIPIIYFGTDMAGMGSLLRETGADVIGVDWRIPLDDAWARLGDVAVQGNLDPMVLFAPPAEIERRAADIIQRAAGRPGHIFNLGHGILTETPVEHVRHLAEYVQSIELAALAH